MSSVGELKNYKYGAASGAHQAQEYDTTTKEIAGYVARLYGQDMKVLVASGKESPPIEPKYPEGDKATNKDKAIWSKEYDIFARKRDRYEEYKAKVFAIIVKQCEKAVINHLETRSEFEKAEQTSDVPRLLTWIKQYAFEANEKKYPHGQAVRAWRQLMLTRQYDNEDLLEYYKRFASLVEF